MHCCPWNSLLLFRQKNPDLWDHSNNSFSIAFPMFDFFLFSWWVCSWRFSSCLWVCGVECGSHYVERHHNRRTDQPSSLCCFDWAFWTATKVAATWSRCWWFGLAVQNSSSFFSGWTNLTKNAILITLCVLMTLVDAFTILTNFFVLLKLFWTLARIVVFRRTSAGSIPETTVPLPCFFTSVRAKSFQASGLGWCQLTFVSHTQIILRQSNRQRHNYSASDTS